MKKIFPDENEKETKAKRKLNLNVQNLFLARGGFNS